MAMATLTTKTSLSVWRALVILIGLVGFVVAAAGMVSPFWHYTPNSAAGIFGAGGFVFVLSAMILKRYKR